jgi:hypothetical protein
VSEILQRLTSSDDRVVLALVVVIVVFALAGILARRSR